MPLMQVDVFPQDGDVESNPQPQPPSSDNVSSALDRRRPSITETIARRLNGMVAPDIGSTEDGKQEDSYGESFGESFGEMFDDEPEDENQVDELLVITHSGEDDDERRPPSPVSAEEFSSASRLRGLFSSSSTQSPSAAAPAGKAGRRRSSAVRLSRTNRLRLRIHNHVTKAVLIKERKIRNTDDNEQKRSKALLQALAGAQIVQNILQRAAAAAEQKSRAKPRKKMAKVLKTACKSKMRLGLGVSLQRAINGQDLTEVKNTFSSGLHSLFCEPLEKLFGCTTPTLFSRTRFEKRVALAHFALYHGGIFGNGLTRARCHAIKPLAERYTRASFNDFVWFPICFITLSLAMNIFCDNGGGFLLCALWASSSGVFGLLDSLRDCDATGAINIAIPWWLEYLDSNVVFCFFAGLAEVMMTGAAFKPNSAYWWASKLTQRKQVMAGVLGSGALIQRMLAYALVQDQIGAIIEKTLEGVENSLDGGHSIRNQRGVLHRELFSFVAVSDATSKTNAAKKARVSRHNSNNPNARKKVRQSLIDELAPKSNFLESAEDESSAVDENVRHLIMALTVKNCLTCCELLAGSSMNASFTFRVYDKLHHDRYNEPAAAELLSLEMNRILINAVETSATETNGWIFAERMLQPLSEDVVVYLLMLLRTTVLAHVNACMNARIATSQNWISNDVGAEVNAPAEYGNTAIITNFLTLVQAVMNSIRLAELAISAKEQVVEAPSRPDGQAAHYLLQQELSFLDILGAHAHNRQQRQLRTIVNGGQSPAQRGAELRRKTASLIRAGVASTFKGSEGGSISDVSDYIEIQRDLQRAAKAAWKRIQLLFQSTDEKPTTFASAVTAKQSRDAYSKSREVPKSIDSNLHAVDPLEKLLLRLSILNESTSNCDVMMVPSKLKKEDPATSPDSSAESYFEGADGAAVGSSKSTGVEILPMFKRVYVIFGQDDVHPLDELNEMDAKPHLELASLDGSEHAEKWSSREAVEIKIDESTHEAFVLLSNKNKKPDVMIR
jgi:hypothetical protein